MLLLKIERLLPDDTATLALPDEILRQLLDADLDPIDQGAIVGAPDNRTALQEIGRLLDGAEIAGSHDLGGHGGTLRAAIPLADGSKAYVFLKPKDPIEFRNYQMIGKLSPDLVQFMPKIYGEIRVDGAPFMVMENVRYSASGEPLEQLADIKLAGKLRGEKDFGAIVCQREMRATRKHKKPRYDQWQMRLATQSAPDYMIARGKLRPLNYHKSERLLKRALRGTDTVHILDLISQLRKIDAFMKTAPFSLIGASVIVVKQTDGSLKALLIEPAHMAIYKSGKGTIQKLGLGSVAYFDSHRVELQKKSNKIAIESLADSLHEICWERQKK